MRPTASSLTRLPVLQATKCTAPSRRTKAKAMSSFSGSNLRMMETLVFRYLVNDSKLRYQFSLTPTTLEEELGELPAAFALGVPVYRVQTRSGSDVRMGLPTRNSMGLSAETTRHTCVGNDLALSSLSLSVFSGPTCGGAKVLRSAWPC